ncbi:MAG: hypothetical protein ACLQG3_04610 [Terracidiphilus sp.]
MELTCNRCHQTVETGDCYCPFCGLPQIVYSADDSSGQGQPDRSNEAVRDAGSVDWKAALRLVLALAIPAGVLSSMFSPVGIFGPVLMAVAAAWVVAIYLRSQRPRWLTLAAGARIGLVTGILGSWAAALVTGVTLCIDRYWRHQGNEFDALWQSNIDAAVQKVLASGADPQMLAVQKAFLLSPEGRGGSMLVFTAFLCVILLVFAIAGGALGARFLGRPRRTQS